MSEAGSEHKGGTETHVFVQASPLVRDARRRHGDLPLPEHVRHVLEHVAPGLVLLEDGRVREGVAGQDERVERVADLLGDFALRELE